MDGLLTLVISAIDTIALAGGGGSGGGGGGGGGGGFSGGGGSGGSGGGGPFSFIIFLIFILVFGVLSVIASRDAAKKLKQRRDRMKAALSESAAKDTLWEEGSLVTRGKDTFIRYQKDWSEFNLDSMKTYMTERYYNHNLLMMGALKVLNRRNQVDHPTVTFGEVHEMRDSNDDTADKYTVRLHATAYDILEDTQLNKKLFSQFVTTTEYYKFVREDNTWRFDGIDQETADPSKRNPSLVHFAQQNGYFYSLDWGHLLLPRRGQLFRNGSFGQSDINNHVIGLYNDIIIQLYTYNEDPLRKPTSYLIAQTAVPKSYGNIVVRRKKGIFAGGTRGLRKLSMEWTDFNSKYEVFASNTELATSFELLNPKYMEQLQAVPFEVNIEVVDNIVYLYAPEMATLDYQNYTVMLELLKAAFKEMRM